MHWKVKLVVVVVVVGVVVVVVVVVQPGCEFTDGVQSAAKFSTLPCILHLEPIKGVDYALPPAGPGFGPQVVFLQ